jgi:uncharacterized protein YbjQ (UPF0145 family)
MTDPPEWEARRQAIRDAVQAVYAPHKEPVGRHDRPVTSDLSIDEALLLHSIQWEPLDLVCGAGVYSITQGSWQWAVGEIDAASRATTAAMDSATDRLQQECIRVGGAGVIGVRISLSVERHAANAVLTGTAVAPSSGAKPKGRPFMSDLSGRDFALLHNAGWEACGLAYGAAFVHVPRRSAGTTMQQASQNIELTNFTEAMYAARESAMERMQSSALYDGATGVVAVQVMEGPMEFARHAISFTAWGTAVRPAAGGHRYLQPRVTLPVNDTVSLFDAASLRGA